MNSEVTLLTENIGPTLSDCVRQARHRLTLVAPFIKRKALERLLAEVAPCVALTVFTRWSVDEIIAGVSDLSVFDFVRKRNDSHLLLHARLHAKVIQIDDKVVAIGSANFTDTSLGFAGQPNAEIMAILQPILNRLFRFLLHLERDAVPATEELRRQLEETAKAAPPPWTPPAIAMPGQATRGPPTLFPCFRNPERLHSGYLSVAEFSDRATRAAILDDLEVLTLPDGLDEPTFRQRVGVVLLTVEPVGAFDEFVAQPRHFGEMTEWLKARGVLADQSQDDRKRYVQTLVRWLRYFLPGRYRLEEPNYSELFGRAEGWGRA